MEWNPAETELLQFVKARNKSFNKDRMLEYWGIPSRISLFVKIKYQGYEHQIIVT